MTRTASGPLVGLKILDLSTLVAGPWAATLLADLGAEVLKIELPNGSDPLRALPPHKDGVPLWWKTTNRNKRGITLDVRTDPGRAVFLKLLADYDVLIENFRTGTMDRWGLDRETLFAAQPRLTVLRVTGFGQTGPYRSRPGLARIFEAMSGFTHICGSPDGPPQHAGFPIGDSVAGLFGALGILAASFHRLRNPDAPGQEIDLAATEAMFRVLDFLAPEYQQLGTVRERVGNLNAYAAPANIYRTADGKWLSLAVSTQSLFERLTQAMQRPDLLGDPRFATNADRVRHCAEIDAIVSDWMAQYAAAQLVEMLSSHDVTFSSIYSIHDVLHDPHFIEREVTVPVPDATLGDIRMHNVVPRFSATPGAIRHSGPDLGQDNAEVFRELGLSDEELQALRSACIV
ncbi:MAG: CoA transferase [Paraburkholderia sp.]|jgi:crotonobetainyl-CoA:carnitine CoA-transferase CaiB-like acyl-CoA transferase|nr:CoA transferase [Paraburkholderia sp.]